MFKLKNLRILTSSIINSEGRINYTLEEPNTSKSFQNQFYTSRIAFDSSNKIFQKPGYEWYKTARFGIMYTELILLMAIDICIVFTLNRI